MAELEDERAEELGALEAIFPELQTDRDHFTATLELPVSPTKPLLVRFVPQASKHGQQENYAKVASNGCAHIERDVVLSHLPPLSLEVKLPDGYPSDAPPKVHLTTELDWLPRAKLAELQSEAGKLWEEYGRCQIVYSLVDFLQQAAENRFDLDQSADGCLVLPTSAEKQLVAFDETTKLAVFNAGTYDCGICLEPKKGSSCYKMKRCGHVFCRQCLQDFYNNAITEGDVAGIRCLDPTCGKEPTTPNSLKRKRKTERTLHARELLAMGIDEAMVRRYVEMKRKKKLETDKTTVWCPRTWCQGPAKSKKYPPIPTDLAAYTADDAPSDQSDSESAPTQQPDSPTNPIPADPADRVAVCEKCSLAFCRVCYMGWHGQFARCFPRDPSELSAEEKASYDYIRTHTSPCPTCSSPTQKTMGCNHMKCYQCNTHFCYLCGAWLNGENPYHHFNKQGSPCFQRLWELEEGDEGQAAAFAGARAWEQMAMDVAREADEAEAEAAAAAEAVAREAHEREDGRAVQRHVVVPQLDGVAVALAQIHLDDPPPPGADPRPGGRRPRNPNPARPAAPNIAQAVRRHERPNGAGNNGRMRRRQAPEAAVNQDEEDRQQAELQRFLELARRDEEDGWDSDELDGDDGRFVIR
ncbi:hypothetical protein LTR53_011412 [Teratosphaeriaceae sp. CCFEE 6253]|nr:hypothetical protein LTR53_011412 [Teratosphaeriaceae sp. CCFEE 6253]